MGICNLSLFIEAGALELIRRLGNFLSPAGTPSYIVGGLVRDSLLGRRTADIDIAVLADALKVAQDFAAISGGSYVTLDAVNRIGRVILPEPLNPSSGKKWTVDFSTINGTIHDDLARRDFTIDAMAFPLPDFARDHRSVPLIDPFSGLKDLRNGTVRSVTKTSVSDDPVRLLRGVRLAFELGFKVDTETEEQISGSASLIAGVPGERVREELLRLLDIPKSGEVLPYLDRLKLLTAVVPELEAARGVTQPREHYWDVFEHTLEAVAVIDFILHRGGWRYGSKEILSAIPWSDTLGAHFEEEVSAGSTRRLMLKLAALLHDIAKPQTRAPDRSGRIRFLGHGNEGAEAVARIMERLRFSTREIKLVAIMVKYHLRPGQMRQDGEMPTHRAIYRFFRDTEGAGTDILFINLADHLAARGPTLIPGKWQEHCEFAANVLEEYQRQQEETGMERLISGDDLINTFGMKPGPEIGMILEQVHEAQAAGEIKSRAEALDYVRSLLDTIA